MNKVMVVIIGLFLTVSVQAEGSKRESVVALLEATNADAIIDNMYGQMNQVLQGMGSQLGVKPEEEPILNAYMEKIAKAMQEEMSWKKMEGPMIDIYLKHYTEKEIQDMLAFYRSDTGRSMVEKMPAVMSDSMVVSQQMMQGFMPKIQVLSQELAADLKKSRSQ